MLCVLPELVHDSLAYLLVKFVKPKLKLLKASFWLVELRNDRERLARHYCGVLYASYFDIFDLIILNCFSNLMAKSTSAPLETAHADFFVINLDLCIEKGRVCVDHFKIWGHVQ